MRPRMNDAPAECRDSLERRSKIAYPEIRQREGVSRSPTTAVHSDDGALLARLPTLAFALGARLEPSLEKLRPEAARTIGVVRWKLNQR
jgi:hypothetical protein